MVERDEIVCGTHLNMSVLGIYDIIYIIKIEVIIFFMCDILFGPFFKKIIKFYLT